MGLVEKLALPFLALCWITTILVLAWIVFRPESRPRRRGEAEPDATATVAHPRGPLTAAQKVALSRRRRLAR